MTARWDLMAELIRHYGRAIGLLVVLVVLADCATGPPAPLMSPIQVAGAYGYSEVPIGGNRYAVSYTGPSQRTLRTPNARQETAAAEHTQAYDFALWRAAQIALPYYGPGLFTHRHLGGPGSYWGPYGGSSPYAFQQTSVTIDVTLLQSLAAGDYDAHETIDQFRKVYPGAEGTALPQPVPS